MTVNIVERAPAGMAGEPLVLGEFQRHMRLANESEDARLIDCIKSARALLERRNGWAIAKQTYLFTLPYFPGATIVDIIGPFPGFTNNPLPSYNWSNFEIKLPRPPLLSIKTFKYLDPVSAALVDMPSNGYQVFTQALGIKKILPPDGQNWPQTRERMDAVQITYEAGYAEAADVPEDLKHALKLATEQLFDGHSNFEDAIEALMCNYRDESWPV